MVEVLSGVLAGAAIGPEIASMYAGPERPQGVGHFFMLMDISAFMPVADFRGRMDRMIDMLKAAPKAPGADEILVPGERSHRRARENLRLGVPVSEAVIAELRELSSEYGLKWRPVEV
jgi:LDH2 family malate/lactate/ureidoglycolate dehydrogenase